MVTSSLGHGSVQGPGSSFTEYLAPTKQESQFGQKAEEAEKDDVKDSVGEGGDGSVKEMEESLVHPLASEEVITKP